MQVRVHQTVETDRIVVVDSGRLRENLHLSDIDFREEATIQEAYHKDWFYSCGERSYFRPPAAYLRLGRIYFINGRHRTELLSTKTKEFPMLVGNLDNDHIGFKPSEASLQLFDHLVVREIHEHSIFELPDFPIGDFPPA